MNQKLKITLKTILYLILVWFIIYFVFGEQISLEFADYQFAHIFPKILTFAAGASIYLLILLTIKKSKGWSIVNILKFIAGIIFAFVPFLLFKYYSSVANCQDWEITKKNIATLYVSTTSNSEKIKSVETYCQEMDQLEVKSYRVAELTPLFNVVWEIDTANISPEKWKKLK